jgi:hypothetical protein
MRDAATTTDKIIHDAPGSFIFVVQRASSTRFARFRCENERIANGFWSIEKSGLLKGK